MKVPARVCFIKVTSRMTSTRFRLGSKLAAAHDGKYLFLYGFPILLCHLL